MPLRHALIVAALIGSTTSAVAQELSVPDTSGAYADSLLQRRLGDSMMNYQRRNRDGVPNARLSPSARATCLDKRRVASGLSPAKAQRLYSLCAQAGY